jgi:catechol 2,3-dioxygenase-like lactoylglutathione lyase family enzyme
MKAVGVFVMALVLLSPGARAAGPAPALLRTTLIVADVDRSIAFYGHLGFGVESDRGGPRKPGSPFPLAVKAGTFRLVVLASPDPEGGRIGLLSFADPAPPVLVPPREQVGIGDMVFVVRVPDALAAYRALQSGGARFVEPAPVPYETKRPDGTPWQGALFHAFDPDGRLVEVMAAAVDAPPAGK